MYREHIIRSHTFGDNLIEHDVVSSAALHDEIEYKLLLPLIGILGVLNVGKREIVEVGPHEIYKLVLDDVVYFELLVHSVFIKAI